MYSIGKVADTIMSVTGLTNSDIDTVWSKIDETIKEGHTLQEVKNYILKKIKQGEEQE